jgi:hypothetical protein
LYKKIKIHDSANIARGVMHASGVQMGKVSRRDRREAVRDEPEVKVAKKTAPVTPIYLNRLYPPPVEGRCPSKEEFAMKSTNGRHYFADVWIILREFPTEVRFSCRTDLSNLHLRLTHPMKTYGYTFVDASDALNDIRHSLHLASAWALLVHEARTSEKFIFLRRTVKNSGAMLMLQRQEHLRGECDECSPISFICLVRDNQLNVIRDSVTDQLTTEKTLLTLASQRDDCASCGQFLCSRQNIRYPCKHSLHLDCCSNEHGFSVKKLRSELFSLGCPVCKRAGNAAYHEQGKTQTNMPKALFKQQLAAIDSVTTLNGIGPPPYEKHLNCVVRINIMPAVSGPLSALLDISIQTKYFNIPVL